MNICNNLPITYIQGYKLVHTKLPDKYTQYSISKFSGIELESYLKDFHPFGFLVYVLEEKLQKKKSFIKWMDRSHIGYSYATLLVTPQVSH